MNSVTYLSGARDDLREIWRYIVANRGSVEIAERMIRRIEASAQRYADQPLLGELRPDLSPDVRCFPVGQFVVLYVPVPDGIEVTQIIHGARDIPRHYR